MIALWLGLALADPCGREVVVGRGLVVEAGDGVSATAELDLTLTIKKRTVDGIPSWFVRHVDLAWRWTVAASGPFEAVSQIGAGDATCEPSMGLEHRFTESPGEWSYTLKKIDACRIRVVLDGTMPAVPTVTLEVKGPTPPGPDAPVSGAFVVTEGDVVIDIPGCL